MDIDADVVVVGGGPGGSAVSTLIAAQGHRVLLLEKEHFPRYQIGESLLPATVHGIGRLLGVSRRLAEAGFMPKRGGTFRWGESPEPWTFAFAVSDVFSGPTSTAYQVERMKFDQILLDNARDKGVEVREGARVESVLESGGRIGGVVYTGEDGVRTTVRSRFVVDASGNNSRYPRPGRRLAALLGVLQEPGSLRLLRGRRPAARAELRQHPVRRLRRRLVLVHPADRDAHQRRARFYGTTRSTWPGAIRNRR